MWLNLELPKKEICSENKIGNQDLVLADFRRKNSGSFAENAERFVSGKKKSEGNKNYFTNFIEYSYC